MVWNTNDAFKIRDYRLCKVEWLAPASLSMFRKEMYIIGNSERTYPAQVDSKEHSSHVVVPLSRTMTFQVESTVSWNGCWGCLGLSVLQAQQSEEHRGRRLLPPTIA